MVDEACCIVLGDVVGSQGIDDQTAFLDDLSAAIASINEAHGEQLIAPFRTIKGIDELGGVLETPAPIADINRRFTRRVHPTRLRLAAVVGRIETGRDTGDVTRMSGPGFSRADRLLSTIESEDLTFGFDGSAPVIDAYVTDEINLLDIVRYDWSPRKMEVIRVYETVDSQKAAAAELGISQQAVSKHLRTGHVRTVLAIESRLDERLVGYPEGPS